MTSISKIAQNKREYKVSLFKLAKCTIKCLIRFYFSCFEWIKGKEKFKNTKVDTSVSGEGREMKAQDNYDFFMETDVSSYIGEWIAICDKKIVSHGNKAKKVFEKAKKKYPKTKLLLTKVPEKEAMIF